MPPLAKTRGDIQEYRGLTNAAVPNLFWPSAPFQRTIGAAAPRIHFMLNMNFDKTLHTSGAHFFEFTGRIREENILNIYN